MVRGMASAAHRPGFACRRQGTGPFGVESYENALHIVCATPLLCQDTRRTKYSLSSPTPPPSGNHAKLVTALERRWSISAQAGIVKATVSGVMSGVTSVVRLEPFRGALEDCL